MKEELKQIGLELHKWAKKYNKDHISIAVVNGTIMFLSGDFDNENGIDIVIRDKEGGDNHV